MTKSTAAIRTVNVTRTFRQARESEIVAGLNWYREAHEFAHDVAADTGRSPTTVAAVTAAVSPRLSWPQNKRLAERLVRTNDTSRGYLGSGLARARRLLDGEDVYDVLVTDKILNFYESIVTHGAMGICIDRHAFDVATGVRHADAARPAINRSRYAAASEAYRRASRIASAEIGFTIPAAQLQAITWVTWKRLNNIAA